MMEVIGKSTQFKWRKLTFHAKKLKFTMLNSITQVEITVKVNVALQMVAFVKVQLKVEMLFIKSVPEN